MRSGGCAPDERIRGVSPLPSIEVVLVKMRHVEEEPPLVEFWNLVGKTDEDF